jgi:hypothetical protein
MRFLLIVLTFFCFFLPPYDANATDYEAVIPALHFEIRVPVGAKEIFNHPKQPLTHNILNEIMRLQVPLKSGGMETISIQAMQFKMPFSARYWLKDYLKQRNIFVADNPNLQKDTMAIADFIEVQGDTSNHVTIWIKMNGDGMLVGEYATPETAWKERAPVIKAFFDNIQFTQPQPIINIPFTPFAFYKYAQLEYPTDWKINVDQEKDPRRLDVIIEKPNKNNFSDNAQTKVALQRIYVRVIPRQFTPKVQPEIQRFRADLEKQNQLIFRSLIESRHDIQYAPNVKGTGLDIYAASINMANQDTLPQEVYLGVQATKDSYILTASIIPTRERDFYTWAQNVMIVENLIKSIAPL